MSAIRIHDKVFRPYITAADINSRVQQMAAQISADHTGKQPLFICVLNGAFLFAADLFRNITIPAEIAFVKLTSYEGMKSVGEVVAAPITQDVAGRHIIIIEDIVDTGRTLHFFKAQLQLLQPAGIQVATLLTKPDARIFDITLDYAAFEIADKFVVGYGLDYDGLGRNYPDIYQYSGEEA